MILYYLSTQEVTAMEIQIEISTPVPQDAVRRIRYPLKSLAIGHSFTVANAEMRRVLIAACVYKPRHPG